MNTINPNTICNLLELKKQHFIILTPPRSRSAWLANFMTWGPCFAFHEALPEVPRVRMLLEKFDEVPFSVVGTVDNGAACFSKELLKTFPAAQFVVVHRPLEEVKEALLSIGLPQIDEYLEMTYAGLHRIISERPDTLEINFKDISKNLLVIWQHCTGTPLPDYMAAAFWSRAEFLERTTITVDLRKERARMSFFAANVDSLFTVDADEVIVRGTEN